jgi:large subunit ribosomal protein L19
MEGSSFSAEQFARTRKPFDVPVTTKLPLEERRPSAAKLLSTLAQNEVSSLKKLPRELARFDVGDRIAVTQLLSLHEDKLQTIKGVVVSKRRREYLNASFTILNVIDGVKAEVLIPLYSPFIRKIEVIDRLKERGFKTTQRKLYHFRNLANTDRRVKALL